MIFALIIGLMSCGNEENTANAKSPEKDRVDKKVLIEKVCEIRFYEHLQTKVYYTVPTFYT